jgi:hypothetical protein
MGQKINLKSGKKNELLKWVKLSEPLNRLYIETFDILDVFKSLEQDFEYTREQEQYLINDFNKRIRTNEKINK